MAPPTIVALTGEHGLVHVNFSHVTHLEPGRTTGTELYLTNSRTV